MTFIDRIKAIEELLIQLRDRGNEVAAQGPANNVRKASLSISDDKGERLTKVHVECSFDVSPDRIRGVVKCIAAALNEYVTEQEQGGAR